MTGARLYPGADHSIQWRGNNRPIMPAVDKLLLHTTESSGWPSYPTFSPTFTFNPWEPRGKRWRQHCFVNQAATTLANAGTFRTNRANVCQIEIVAWVDPAHKTSPAFYTRISDDAYLDLSEFYAWLNKEWDTPIRNTLKWKEYPASYGVKNGVRLSVAEFGTYEGLCGHQHAPEQAHGDPSLINVSLILKNAQAIAGGDPMAYPTPKTNDVYLSKLHVGQQDSDSVWQVQNALRKLGYDVPLTGDFDSKTLEERVHQLFNAAGITVQIHNDL
jgi:hypothetical protein